MKAMMTFLAILTASSTAFAGREDLRTMRMLTEIGAASEQFMSQIHMRLSDIDCSYSYYNGSHYVCSMKDESANEGEGKVLVLRADAAKRLYTFLVKAGAAKTEAQGQAEISVRELRCTQAVAGVMDGSEAQRTVCQVTLKGE
ncbi:MAG: hypothetical protein V4760_09440 [Bdellovibrionota bacterium]